MEFWTSDLDILNSHQTATKKTSVFQARKQHFHLQKLENTLKSTLPNLKLLVKSFWQRRKAQGFNLCGWKNVDH